MKKDSSSEKYKLDKGIWEIEKKQANNRKYNTILRLYSLTGIVVAFFGVAYFVLSSLNIQFTQQQLVALLLIGVGITLAVVSHALIILKEEKRKDELERLETIQELSLFLSKWIEFEELSKKEIKNKNVEFNRFSIKDIIKILLEEEKIDRSDALILEEAIQNRNLIVHGGRMLPKDMISNYLKNLDEIIYKISKENK